MEYTTTAPTVFYVAPALVVEYLAPASIAYVAPVATKMVGFGSLLVAECRDAVCVGCTFVVIVVLHRRSACWSFSLKILEARKARLRSTALSCCNSWIMTLSIPVVTVCSWTTACFRQEVNTMCTEASYPFSATDGTRNLSGCQESIPQDGVVDYTDASTDNEQARMSAVAQQPVSIAIVVLFWYVHRFMRYASRPWCFDRQK